MSSVIGMDLGGTNLRAAQISPIGEVGIARQVQVDHSADAPPRFGQITAMIAEILDSMYPEPVTGIALSVTGPVDPVTGWVDNPFTLPPAMQGDLVGAIRAKFEQPVVVENDANAAALGEALFGAGRAGATVVCVTVGTGIGVGVVNAGRLYDGAGRAHPEAGHLVVDPNGPRCYCGASGCMESLASATAVVEAGVADGVVGEGSTAHDVYKRAAEGDDRALRIVERAQDALAAGVRTLVAVYAPDVVVLAGNAQGDQPHLVRVVQDAVDHFPFGAPSVVVRSAELGNWAGCIGAASMLVADR